MKIPNKLIILLVILASAGLYLGGYISGDINRESKTKVIMNEFRERQIRRDSLIEAYQFAIRDMQVTIDSLVIERDLYRTEIDGTLVVIERLTKPVVTDETIAEALEWIEHYNDTL